MEFYYCQIIDPKTRKEFTAFISAKEFKSFISHFQVITITKSFSFEDVKKFMKEDYYKDAIVYFTC